MIIYNFLITYSKWERMTRESKWERMTREVFSNHIIALRVRSVANFQKYFSKLNISGRGVNHSLEISGNPYKKSEISYAQARNLLEKSEISYAKCWNYKKPKPYTCKIDWSGPLDVYRRISTAADVHWWTIQRMYRCTQYCNPAASEDLPISPDEPNITVHIALFLWVLLLFTFRSLSLSTSWCPYWGIKMFEFLQKEV